MNPPKRPQGLIDRIIKKRHCPTGRIGDLNPEAFARAEGDKHLSFSDRQQKTPEEALKDYNSTLGWPEEKQGKWTVAIHVSQAESIVCVDDVIFDNPEKPAHVAVILNPQRTKKEERMMREKMVALAQERGLFPRGTADENPGNVRSAEKK